jgi:DNA-binding NtrC family response regulator
MSYNILLVDDDATQASVVERIINDNIRYNTRIVSGGQEAIDLLTSVDSGNIDLVLLDLSMPGVDGIAVLKAVKPIRSNLPFIVRTGFDDVDMAVEAMRSGATDFVKKFDSAERLRKSIDNALRLHVLNDEMSLLKRSKKIGTCFSDIVGDSPAVKEMIELGQKVSKSHIPVLLEGESGCGKEFMARAIHAASDRADKPFIAVNCGAIPENLVESILFGHEKGAFTGALYKTFGKFREADGGTIFLDEAGELTPDIQVKLLRVLQDGEIDPVGSTRPIKVDVRIISATNRNLMEEVKEKHFREDLYYRLNVFPIYVPPLRARSGDVVRLIKYFIDSFVSSEKKNISGIAADAEDMLCHYKWPGNIRQLKNTIFRAVVLCEGNVLNKEDFPQVISGLREESEADNNAFAGGSNSINGLLMQEDGSDFRKLSDIEKDVIVSALDHYHGHMSEVARKLGIGRSTLYRKLDEFNIPHNGHEHRN